MSDKLILIGGIVIGGLAILVLIVCILKMCCSSQNVKGTEPSRKVKGEPADTTSTKSANTSSNSVPGSNRGLEAVAVNNDGNNAPKSTHPPAPTSTQGQPAPTSQIRTSTTGSPAVAPQTSAITASKVQKTVSSRPIISPKTYLKAINLKFPKQGGPQVMKAMPQRAASKNFDKSCCDDEEPEEAYINSLRKLNRVKSISQYILKRR